MSKHTPAPWYAPIWHGDEKMNKRADALGISRVPALTNDGSRFVITESGRVALVDCKTEYKRGKGHQTECAERDANARLIAAAPELLDALKACIKGRDDREACVTEALMVIAKAEGK
jgi:hypothetical protein